MYLWFIGLRPGKLCAIKVGQNHKWWSSCDAVFATSNKKGHSYLEGKNSIIVNLGQTPNKSFLVSCKEPIKF